MYKIQTEGKPMQEVIRVNATVRIDLDSTNIDSLSIVKELKKYTYEVKSSHTLDGIRICYVLITGIKPVNKKRFICVNSKDMGIDNNIEDENGNVIAYVWYVYDKELNRLVENEEGNRSYCKSVCDRMNKRYMDGTLKEIYWAE